MSTKKPKKNPHIFCCELCDFQSSHKNDYNKHIVTKKHLYNQSQPILGEKTQEELHQCFCGKKYKDKSGLWRHKKKCFADNNADTDTVTDINKPINITTEMVLSLIKDNKELKDMLVQQNNTINNLVVTNNLNITNTNTKHFNLNFFLNETCKNAMNISDFVSSIKVNLEDLENTGKKGYAEGISSIIIKNLNNIENHLRPLHCSDVKREIIYIKDNDEWIKESEEKPILINAIKTIANENIKQISVWKQLHPGCTLSDSNKNTMYLNIVSNSMIGISDEECVNNIHKIISNVSKEVSIDKKLRSI